MCGNGSTVDEWKARGRGACAVHVPGAQTFSAPNTQVKICSSFFQGAHFRSYYCWVTCVRVVRTKRDESWCSLPAYIGNNGHTCASHSLHNWKRQDRFYKCTIYTGEVAQNFKWWWGVGRDGPQGDDCVRDGVNEISARARQPCWVPLGRFWYDDLLAGAEVAQKYIWEADGKDTLSESPIRSPR